jgi:hypothetical protein
MSVLLSSQLAIMSAAPAALAACNPGRSHDNAARYASTVATISGISGVSSDVEEYDPYYSGQNGTGTNATIMITKANLDSWAQLGWFKSKIQGGITK